MNEKVEVVGGKRFYDARKAVIVDRGKILLLKINVKKTQLGFNPELGIWEVPGGRMQNGDTDEDTLNREIMEEAGISAKIERELSSFEFLPRPDVIIRAKCFLCTPLSLDVKLEDPEEQHEDYIWANLDEALSYDIPIWLKQAIKALKVDTNHANFSGN